VIHKSISQIDPGGHEEVRAFSPVAKMSSYTLSNSHSRRLEVEKNLSGNKETAKWKR